MLRPGAAGDPARLGLSSTAPVAFPKLPRPMTAPAKSQGPRQGTSATLQCPGRPRPREGPGRDRLLSQRPSVSGAGRTR